MFGSVSFVSRPAHVHNSNICQTPVISEYLLGPDWFGYLGPKKHPKTRKTLETRKNTKNLNKYPKYSNKRKTKHYPESDQGTKNTKKIIRIPEI